MAEKRFVGEQDLTRRGWTIEDETTKDMAALVTAAVAPIDHNGAAFVGEIGSPDGASVLAAANNLQLRAYMEFQSAQRVADGTVNFVYKEQSEQVGEFRLPSDLVLVLMPFGGAEAVEIAAKIDYTQPRGGEPVKFRVRLNERFYRIPEEALQSMAEAVQLATEVSVLRGTAPA